MRILSTLFVLLAVFCFLCAVGLFSVEKNKVDGTYFMAMAAYFISFASVIRQDTGRHE